MAGATSSYRVRESIGEKWVISCGPLLIAASLILLGYFKQTPALVFAAAISFFTAILRPIVMHRIQSEVTDNIRATALSMQSLLFAFIVAFVEPVLGYAADQSGLSAAYYILAGGLVLYTVWLIWKSRPHFP